MDPRYHDPRLPRSGWGRISFSRIEQRSVLSAGNQPNGQGGSSTDLGLMLGPDSADRQAGGGDYSAVAAQNGTKGQDRKGRVMPTVRTDDQEPDFPDSPPADTCRTEHPYRTDSNHRQQARVGFCTRRRGAVFATVAAGFVWNGFENTCSVGT